MNARALHGGLLSGVLIALGALPAWGAQLEVVLVSRLPEGELVKVDLLLRRGDTAADTLSRAVSDLGKPQVIDLAEGSWSVGVKAPGIWALERSVSLAKDGARRIQMEIYRATSVRGRVTVAAGDSLPTEVGLELYPPIEEPSSKNLVPKRPPPSEALAFRCPVVEGAFDCSGPVGRWDVRLRARDHVSHYLWSIAFPKGKPTSLGTFQLKRGASVVGWVFADGLVAKGEVPKLSLKPLQAGSSVQGDTTERALSLASEANERGFFHFTEVPAGAYVVTARLGGFAPADFFPLRVMENRETQLQEPLVLRPPLTLEVRVSPASDLNLKPWRIQLFDLGNTPGAMELVKQGQVDADGIWRLADVAAGSLLVEVHDAAGTKWAYQETSLNEARSEVVFELDLVEVQGTLHLGGEPLAATLYFGGRNGVPSIRLRSDAAGEFSGHLPKEGSWRVGIESKEPAVQRMLPAVSVRRAPGKQVAKINIELPGGRLHGRVTDSKDQPVADAQIMVAMAGEPPVTLRSSKSGEFETLGFPEGTAAVQGRWRNLESETQSVQLVGKDGPAIHLVLREMREVTAWVLGPSGGVPGAHVSATVPGQLASHSQGVTDPSGRVTLRVPGATTALLLEVLPPGYVLLATRVSLAEGRDLQLFVGQNDGGTLVLSDAGLEQQEEPTRTLPVVLHNGQPISFATLGRWAQVNGRSWPASGARVVPQVEPGEYAVCRVPFSQVPALLLGRAAADRCARGVLAPGRELTLRIPPG